MLNKVQSKTTGDPTPPDTLSGGEVLHVFVSFWRRQSSVILFATFLTTVLGAIYLFIARPSFTAYTQLVIDTHKTQVLSQQQQLIPIDTVQVESQVGILKSENIASAVIKKLNLTKDPEFITPEGGLLRTIFGFDFNEFESADQAPRSEFELFRSAMVAFKNRLRVTHKSYIIEIAFQSHNAERAAQIANAIADAYIIDQLETKYKATRQAGGWLQDRIKELRTQVADAERAVVQFRTEHNIVSTGGTRPLLNQQQVTELSSQLTIARANTADAQARLDRINSVLKTDSSDGSLPDAPFGATVTDTLKNEIVTKLWGQYLDLNALEKNWSSKYGASHLAVVNLRNRKREIRNSIVEELKRLGETFKSDYEIAKQREVALQKELALAVSKSQTTDVNAIVLSELESTAQTYKSIYENYLRRFMEGAQEESFPVSDARVISPATRPLRKSSPDNFRVLGLAGLIGIAFGFGIGILRNLSERVFRTSQQVEDLLQANCIALAPLAGPTSSQRSLSSGYSFLHSLLSTFSHAKGSLTSRSDADSPREVFENLASNSDQNAELAVPSREYTISRLLAGSRRWVIDGRKTIASRLTMTLGGTTADNTATLTTLKISSLPRWAAPVVPDNSPTFEDVAKSPVRKKLIARHSGMVWSVVDAPLSRFSEAIRSIKFANDFRGTFKANRVIGCTSSLPNEGKSTIAFSLAQLMAQVGARTILVDCDLRNPSLSRALAPRARRGLIDVLAEKVELEKAIWTDPSTNLIFLPAVMKVHFVNTNEIVGSVPMKKLFEKLRESYDYIVVDLPPLAPIVDVRAATPIVDSFLFIIEWGQTKIDVVEHALGQAPEVYDNLLGVVLNKVDMKMFGRYAGHQTGYYYHKGYARYGYTE